MSYTVNQLGRVLKNGQVVSPKNMNVLNTNYQIKKFKSVKPILIGGKLFGVTNNGSVVYRNNYGRIVFKMNPNGTKATMNNNLGKRVTKNFELKFKRKNKNATSMMVHLTETGKLVFKDSGGKNKALRGVKIEMAKLAKKIENKNRIAARDHLKNSIKKQLGINIEYVTIPTLNLNVSNAANVARAVQKFKAPLPNLNTKIMMAGASMNKNRLNNLKEIVKGMKNNNNKTRRLGNIKAHMTFL